MYIHQIHPCLKILPNYYNKAIVPNYKPTFSGKKVDIFDGGEHARDIANFSKAVLPEDTEIEQIQIETNKKEPSVKQIKSLLENLKAINSLPADERPDYIAIPGSVSISLLNLSAQIKAVTNKDIELKPNNIKEHKQDILSFLKELSDNPELYKKEIEYMDSLNQGFKYTYDLIQEINKASENGIKVYTSSGHSKFQSIKYLAKERGQTAELYHYLTSGEDFDNAVFNIEDHIQKNNWYDFNLLILSDAKAIKLMDAKNKEHIYSSNHNLESDSCRGIYNLYPVRKNGEIIGFSYTDRNTNQYPIEEMVDKEKLFALTKFVGLDIDDVLADKNTEELFLEYLKNPDIATEQDKELFRQKLFDVKKIFSPQEIVDKKINLKGRYVDSSLKLFFDKNSINEVVFPWCNYERSERPSVKSMFGACFSIFNAIKKDIKAKAESDKNI